MIKETQKAKIERLESELVQMHKIVAEQNEYINKMQEVADDSFANSPYKTQLENKIKMLEMKLKSAQDSKEHAEKIAKAKDERLQEALKANHTTQVKNARGAGRKTKLDDKKDEIKQLRSQGMKIAELAAKYDCSVGKIHKLINE